MITIGKLKRGAGLPLPDVETPDEVLGRFATGATHLPQADLRFRQEQAAVAAETVPTRSGMAAQMPVQGGFADPGNMGQRVEAFNRPSNLGPRGEIAALQARQLHADTQAFNQAHMLQDGERALRTAALQQRSADETLDRFVANAILDDAAKATILRGAAAAGRRY